MDYTVENKNGRVLVHGTLPIDDLVALQKSWEKRGLDSMATGVATALGATLAVCREDDIEAWTQEVNKQAALQSNGDAELEWLLGTDTGISSKTIFFVLASTEQLRTCTNLDWDDVPHDPSDFGRCHRLLEKFPAWRDRLDEVAEAYPAWQPFADAWEQMTALYLEEAPTGYCGKLYDFMRKLRTGAGRGDTNVS